MYNAYRTQSKNLLSGIPENIGCLTRLIHLDLHKNRIMHCQF
ncbi:hypothetical protein V6Z12_A12G071700 [Gossypium hirsutum]